MLIHFLNFEEQNSPEILFLREFLLVLSVRRYPWDLDIRVDLLNHISVVAVPEVVDQDFLQVLQRLLNHLGHHLVPCRLWSNHPDHLLVPTDLVLRQSPISLPNKFDLLLA